jgi:cobalt-zinc-cadmium efflux system outer membrane protein
MFGKAWRAMSKGWLSLVLVAGLSCGCLGTLPEPSIFSMVQLPTRNAPERPREAAKVTRTEPPLARPVDPKPAEVVKREPSVPPATTTPDATPPPQRGKPIADSDQSDIVLAKAEKPSDKDQLLRRLDVPIELPGSPVKLIDLPPLAQVHEREEAIKIAFPPLPELGPDEPLAAGPDGKPFSLGELQKIGMANSPQIRQAIADRDTARGIAIQAGLHPNPNFGYEGDTMGTAGLAGYQGGYLEQTVKTAGKLTYARAAAAADVANADLAVRTARIDLATRIRNGYFGVLMARESVKVNRALVRFTDEIYKVRLEQLTAGQIAPYELTQFRVFAMQARNDLIQAVNRDTAAWKQLAVAVALPGLPPTELVGSADMPIPRLVYGQILSQVMSRHTDVLTSENNIRKARFNLMLAKVGPIPDIDLRVLLQKDFTSNTFLLCPSVAVGGKIPVFDQSQGVIMQTTALLNKAQEDVQRVRNDLTGKLAEAFERYESNRELIEYYREHILPDLVRVYRGSVLRFQTDAERLTFMDVAQPQQNLDDAMGRYLNTLQALWTATVDVASLLQTEDLFSLAKDGVIEPIGNVSALTTTVPASCQAASNPGLLKPDGRWRSPVSLRLEPVEPEVLPVPKPEPTKEEKPSPKEPSQEPPPLKLPEVKAKPTRPRDVFASEREEAQPKGTEVPAVWHERP